MSTFIKQSGEDLPDDDLLHVADLGRPIAFITVRRWWSPQTKVFHAVDVDVLTFARLRIGRPAVVRTRLTLLRGIGQMSRGVRGGVLSEGRDGQHR